MCLNSTAGVVSELSKKIVSLALEGLASDGD